MGVSSCTNKMLHLDNYTNNLYEKPILFSSSVNSLVCRSLKNKAFHRRPMEIMKTSPIVLSVTAAEWKTDVATKTGPEHRIHREEQIHY